MPRLGCQGAMRGERPTSEPVALLVHAFLPIPSLLALEEASRPPALASSCPTGKPDFDNLGKLAADAIKGIVWDDDAAVCDGRVIKRYSECPALRVEVREMLAPSSS